MGCCNNSIIGLYLESENEISQKYTVKLVKVIEVNGFTSNQKEILIKNINKNMKIQEFISLINKIYDNYNILSYENLNCLKSNIKSILTEFLSGEESDNYLINFYKIKKDRHNIRAIKEIFNLFKLVFEKRNKINKASIIFFIKSIINSLKIDQVLSGKDVEDFEEQLNNIYLNNNEIIKIEKTKINIINDRNKSNEDNITNINELNKSFRSNFSNRNIDNYSQNSKDKIKILEEKIKHLEESFNASCYKRLIKLRFYNESEEFPITIYLGEEDKFSLAINKFYEEYPEFEDKQIKFFFKENRIKMSTLVKNINLDDSSKILIKEY